MTLNACLLVFSVAFMGCVLAIPCATRLARWLGAIDRPDQFRRVHKGAVPRMGGLGLATGLALALLAVCWIGRLDAWGALPQWLGRVGYLGVAGLFIVVLGAVDDCRGLSPLSKILGQAAAILVLYAGGYRLAQIEILGLTISTSYPIVLPWAYGGGVLSIDPLCLTTTLAWFLACMNIWNLIDGMDGLAAGVGVIVSGTFLLVAVQDTNLGAALLAAALTGCLIGFLLYNWHPACVFLGDSGSLLIGAWLGVGALDLTNKEGSSVPLLFPVLAMGLPIADTAMAIFRRWVRELPFSAADRRHVHHLLIGLGLTTRQAAVVLYVFTAGLCGAVLLGAAYHSEALAFVLGISGCAAFLLVLTTRRDELACLIGDYHERRRRRGHERRYTRLAWEMVQRLELCDTRGSVERTLHETLERIASDGVQVRSIIAGFGEMEVAPNCDRPPDLTARGGLFRLSDGRDLKVEVEFAFGGAGIGPDIVLRTLQRVALAASARLGSLETAEAPCETRESDPALDASPRKHEELLPLVSEFWDERGGPSLVAMH